MNNEDNVYELLGNVQVLTKEGVETKFEELEASLPQKINDALGTSLDEKIDEAVSNAVIDVGGVTPALLDEVKAELVATDTALQAADTLLDQRITALENAGPSGGTGDVTTEMLNEVKTELENADTALSERVTALEAGGGSGGSTTDELLVLTLDVDIDDITDTATWLLKEVINFDTLYQSYLTKTNKPVVINIGMSDDTGSTQYSFRDVITSADNTQIRITGDAMSAAIAPNLRFTIDLVLIKDETTGNCTINTTESKFLMQKAGDDVSISARVTALENKDLTLTDNITALQEADVSISARVTALEAGGGSTADDLDNYTYIIDSQEKFDAFCLASNASEADGNDYSHVLIKNGNYTIIEGHGIRLDNTAVPILSITGESQDGVAIDLQATYAFYCLEKENQITQSISTLSITAFGVGYYIFYKVDHVTNVTSYAKAASQGSPAVYSYVFYYCNDVQNCITYHNVVAINESSTCTNCTFGENDSIYSENDIKLGSNSIYNNCTFSYNERLIQYKTARVQFSGNTFIACILNIPAALDLGGAIIRQCTITTCNWYCNSQKTAQSLIEDSTITIDTVRANPSTGSFYAGIQDAIVNNVNFYISSIAISEHSVPNSTGIQFIQYSKVSNVTIQIDRVLRYTAIFNACTAENCHVFINEAGKSVSCFSNCETLVNCSNYIDAVHYGAGTAIVFAGCKNLTNCTAYLTRLTKENTPNNINSGYSVGYSRCYNLRDCCVALDAKYIATDTTQASYVQCIGYSACSTLANCTFKHVSLQPYASTTIAAYANCNNLTSCMFIPDEVKSSHNALNVQIDTTQSTSVNYNVYYLCYYMTNCYSSTVLSGSNIPAKLFDIENMYPTAFYLSALDSTITAQTNSVQISFKAFDTCYFLSNCVTIKRKSSSYVTILIQSDTTFPTNSYVMKDLAHFHQCTYLTNCAAEANNGIIRSTHAVQNCTFSASIIDNTTCSASKSYIADYTLADTPAGGFNNIES